MFQYQYLCILCLSVNLGGGRQGWGAEEVYAKGKGLEPFCPENWHSLGMFVLLVQNQLLIFAILVATPFIGISGTSNHFSCFSCFPLPPILSQFLPLSVQSCYCPFVHVLGLELNIGTEPPLPPQKDTSIIEYGTPLQGCASQLTGKQFHPKLTQQQKNMYGGIINCFTILNHRIICKLLSD